MRSPFKFRVIEDNAGLSRTDRDWNTLLAASESDCLFLTWEWISSWWNHFGTGRRLHVVEVRTGNELLALLPACIVSGRMEFLGTGSVGSDYLDLLIRKDCEVAVCDAIARYLSQSGQTLRFAQLRDNARIQFVAASLARDGFHLVGRTTGLCPFIALEGRTWEQFVSSLGQSHRENVRRRIRSLEKTGATFEMAATDTERRRDLETLFELHNKCREDRGGSDAFHTRELLSFHEEFSALAQKNGWLRLFVLRIEGRPVAAVYGFMRNRKFYFYQSGFEPDFRKQSVGLVALALTIRHAIEERALEYDFLHGNEAYKFLWTSVSRNLKRLDVYPHTFSGSLAMHLNQAASITRRLARYVIPRRP